MKTSRFFLSLLWSMAVFAPMHAAPAKDRTVLDFTRMTRNPDGSYERGFEYDFGDWGDKKVIQTNGEGLLIRLLGSKGGVGSNVGPDFRKHTKARLHFIIGNRNRAESFTLSFVDHDGTDQTFVIPLTGQPKGEEIATLIDLMRPTREDKPGDKPGLDLAKIDAWQIKGNYQAEPIELLVLKLVAVNQ